MQSTSDSFKWKVMVPLLIQISFDIYLYTSFFVNNESTQWHHNERLKPSASRFCLLNCLFRRRTENIKAPCHWPLHHWSLGMDKYFHPTLYNVCNYVSMLGLKVNHVRKRDPRYTRSVYLIKCLSLIWWISTNSTMSLARIFETLVPIQHL